MKTAEHLRVIDGGEPDPGREPSRPPPDPLIGRTLDGRYLIEQVLGEGGMGLVYKAKHSVLGKPLAIKVLRPEVSKDGEIMMRFRQEAQSASEIGNEHIIDITDFGTLPNGSTYFVMEFLNGVSLTGALEKERPFQAPRTIHIAKQLCRGLGAAHERGIVHRDLKPDNIYLIKRSADTNFVKVLDFGIAKVGGASTKLTKAGQVFGTPHYMSPEQCAGSAVDQRTDIYALGVILYEMASGRVPFDADNLMGILTKHLYEQPIPPHNLPPPVDVPPALEAVIMKCLSKSADQRYQTMDEMHEDLVKLEQGQTPKAVLDAIDRVSGTGTTSRDLQPSGIAMGVGGEPEKRSKLPIFIVLGALLAVGLGVGGVVAFGGGEEPEPRVTPVPQNSTPPVPEPQQETQQAAQPQNPPAPGAVMIQLTSIPENAEVYDEAAGELMGNTPLEVERPAQARTLQLRLAGFQTQTVRISRLTQATRPLVVTLQPARVAGGGSGRRRDRGQQQTQQTTQQTEQTTQTQPQQPQPEPRRSSTTQNEVIDPWESGGR